MEFQETRYRLNPRVLVRWFDGEMEISITGSENTICTQDLSVIGLLNAFVEPATPDQIVPRFGDTDAEVVRSVIDQLIAQDMLVAHLERDYDRVFGLGLKGTGTRALGTACEVLGLMSHIDAASVAAYIRTNLGRENRALYGVGDYDVYASIGLEHLDGIQLEGLLRRIDGDYPGSRYVLTTRDFGSWIVAERMRYESEGRVLDEALEGRLWQLWENTHNTVRGYFRDRPADFLELDMTVGDGLEKLSTFLSIATPVAPLQAP